MYVFHVMAIVFLRRVFDSVPMLLLNYLWKLFALLSVVALAFVTAWVSYRLLEQPFLRMKRSFVYEHQKSALSAYRAPRLLVQTRKVSAIPVPSAPS